MRRHLLRGLVVFLVVTIVVVFSYSQFYALVSAQGGVSEIISLRTEKSKTFDLGGGNYKIEVSLRAIHYKDNYANENEPWKNIDLTPDRNGNITKAPYELSQSLGVYTIKNKKTGKVSTIEPTFVNTDATLTVIPGAERVRFQYEITKDRLPFEARYTVTGDGFDSRAYDDIGELSLTTALKAGVLTERLDATIDKATESTRDIVGKIRIDPTWQVGASTDDAFRQLSNNYWNLTYAYFGAGAPSGTQWQDGSGARFTNVTIAQGATITAANLIFRANANMNGANALTRISAEDVDDAATFADNAAAFDARWANRTTARVDWDNIPAWVIDQEDADTTSPDIKTVIQEIVDRPLWVSGNDLVIFWEDFEDRSPHVLYNRRLAYSYDGSTNFCPKLVITYTSVTAPTVVTNAESSITASGATLSGNITATGGEDADERGFEWGIASGVYTDNWTENGAYGVGNFSEVISSMSVNTEYFYRAMAHNSAGWGYGAERNFTTLLPLPLKPTNIVIAKITDFSANITWTKGTYADNTTIRTKAYDYPTSIMDGYEVYNGVGDNVIIGVDLENTEYFFSFWSWNDSGYSVDYATGYIGGEGMNNLTLFLVFVGIIGMGGLWLAVSRRPRNMLISTAVFLVWMFFGFWWLIDDALSIFGITGAWINILYYIPFVFAFAVALDLLFNIDKVVVTRGSVGGGGNDTYQDLVSRSKLNPRESGYDRYEAQLQKRTRR